MNKLKVNDEVVVICGSSKGKTGKIVTYNKKTRKVTIEGVAIQKKFVRPSQEMPSGGVVEKLGTVDVSNVALIGSKGKGNQASKVAITLENNKKVRKLKKTGEVLK